MRAVADGEENWEAVGDPETLTEPDAEGVPNALVEADPVEDPEKLGSDNLD